MPASQGQTGLRSITREVIDAVRAGFDHGASLNQPSQESVMSIFSSPRFLPRVLLADAASGFACGILQLVFTDGLAQWLRLPLALLQGTGWFLLAYGAFAAFLATRRPVPRGMVYGLVIGNLGWGLACVALLLGALLQPGAWGIGYVLLQTVTVVLMAELQWLGLHRAPRAGLSAA